MHSYMYRNACTCALLYHVRCLGEANGHPAFYFSLQGEVKVAAVFTVGVDSNKEATPVVGLVATFGVAE